MGCGASSTEPYQPPEEPEASPAPEVPTENKVEEVEVPGGGDGGGAGLVVAEAPPPDEDNPDVLPEKTNFLPFCRFDKSAVSKYLKSGDEVYFSWPLMEEKFMSCGDGTVNSEGEMSADHAWIVEKVTDGEVFPPPPLMDGDDVRVKWAASGQYLFAPTDHAKLTCTDLDPESSAQIFKFFKRGHPLGIKHTDLCFLQSSLCNYVELEGDGSVRARRWRRGNPQTLSVFRKIVVDSTTTDLARKMQFQAFDLDGSGAISKSDMAYMLRAIRPDEPDLEDLKKTVWEKLDPEGTNQVTFDAFRGWVEGGECEFSEEELQHAEVLGNTAQRCHDTIFEENCFVEVLSTLCPHDTQKALTCGVEHGVDIATEVDEKAGQEGFIFSNYWKHTMKGLMMDEVELWATALNDAMRGWGTDEGTLTALVCTIPEHLRTKIYKKYYEKYEKGLLEHIESETSSSYKKVMVYQAMSPEDCRAKMLNDAMVGMGTDESAIIRIICQTDLGERKVLKEAYERMYQRDLIEHIKSETSGDFKQSLVTLLEADESEFDLEADVEAIKAAMDGWGTDEDTLIRLICSKSPKQMEDLNDKYKELHGPLTILERVGNEISGNFRECMLGVIRHPMDQLAEAVRYCVAGWGTCESGLITLLVHLPDYKKEALKKKYQLKFGRNLIEDLENDTSGDFKVALTSLVKPAPQVWAEALKGAMKGLGTSDELLINFMLIAKDEMGEVRKAFKKNTDQYLYEWLEGDTSGDYQKTLVALSARNSEDNVEMLPIYWMQRCKDAARNIDTLKDILVSLPSVAIKRGTEVFEVIYKKSLKEEVAEMCEEGRSMFSIFSNYWKHSMLSLLEMPTELYVKGLNDAMAGFGTDEYSLTGLVCTMPENLYGKIHKLYAEKYGKTLLDHIESELSFSYKKCMVAQAMSWAESRAWMLNSAMVGMGTTEDQLIRVIVLSSMTERIRIREAYERKYERSLIEHIESETSGTFQAILVAILESDSPVDDDAIDWDADLDRLNGSLNPENGNEFDEQDVIRSIAGKEHHQVDMLRQKYEEKFGENLFDRISEETDSWGQSLFGNSSFRICIQCLLRSRKEQIAYSVRDCIVGWGTDETGLITLLTHLPENKRKELVETYATIDGGGDLFEAIKSDCSGDFETALLALIKPAPVVIAEALTAAMKGLGTSDNLLINWMCIAKPRMDEVREAFSAMNDGQDLADWIDGDCGGADYKDTLIRLARRECLKFPGTDVGIVVQAPPNPENAVLKFNKEFNRLCQKKKNNPDEEVIPTEESEQQMAAVFMYYGGKSSCAPNLDKQGVWDLTNMVGFPPADDGPDLIATFREWDVSGTGEITWNDFVREMTVRINDANHYEADPLPEDE
eukprot:TRINITY_DN2_c0_g1_i1.p1 TRINITY_DN2_c0_g1~~TRINITY_DN2_c0_g1_i1.p1  ORF type:complete len:1368 (+),score=446.78 TRINITY_DN2_c0_g1_i1:80-4183(+)